MVERSHISLAALAALLLAVAVAAPLPTQGQSRSLEDFEGTWVFTHSRSDLNGLAAAINRVADRFDFFVREIARGEMHRRIRPEGRLQISPDTLDRVSFGIDQWGPFRFELGRAARHRGREGADVRVSLTFRDGRLIHREVADNGERTNLLSLNGDGTRLTMQARIGSSQLPADVRYRLTFRRGR